MQTILGSGGAIGIPLAKELRKYTDRIRLVSRNPKKVNDTDELYPADLHDPSTLDQAIAGSEIVYVVVGFEYSLKVWQKIWPAFMAATIAACKKHGAKLVFFDNVYLYAASAIPHMTEASAIAPPSKKGEVRKQLYDMIMTEVNNGSLKALVARAADFYGPYNKASGLSIMVAQKYMKHQAAQGFGDIDRIHTYTYTPDAAKATAQLGNTLDAYGQVWHVPTTKSSLTNRQWAALIAKETGAAPKIQTVPSWMMKILGLFVPIMREFPEMLYQYQQDYVFDSTKFEQRFGWVATEPETGVKVMLEDLKHANGRQA
jgi:nucleoside-diphosphate-sugar epimerase